MTKKELKEKLDRVFDNFVNALTLMEEQFRASMAADINSILGKKVYVDTDFLNLPNELYQLLAHFPTVDWDTYIKNSKNNKALQYYQNSLQSFVNAGKQVAIDSPQDLGIRYESFAINEIDKLVNGKKHKAQYNKLFDVLKVGQPQATGILQKHGDLLFPGLNSYIDFKYTSNTIEIIANPHSRSDRGIVHSNSLTKINSLDILSKRLINEIKNGLYSSLSFQSQDEGWLNPALHSLKSGLSVEESYQSSLQAMAYHKILIYIFSKRGAWASQVVREMQEEIVDRAIEIYDNAGMTGIDYMIEDMYADDSSYKTMATRRYLWNGDI